MNEQRKLVVGERYDIRLNILTSAVPTKPMHTAYANARLVEIIAGTTVLPLERIVLYYGIFGISAKMRRKSHNVVAGVQAGVLEGETAILGAIKDCLNMHRKIKEDRYVFAVDDNHYPQYLIVPKPALKYYK